jgi:hypothetical protein
MPETFTLPLLPAPLLALRAAIPTPPEPSPESSVITNARTHAQEIIQEAIETADELIQQAKLRSQQTPPLPEICYTGVPIRRYNVIDTSRWYIQLTVPVQITHIDTQIERYEHGEYVAYNCTCPAVLRPPTNVELWLPVEADGSYEITRLATCSSTLTLPHVSQASSCLSLGAKPETMKTSSDIVRLQKILQQTFSRIQLNSLYTDRRRWPARVRGSIPPCLRKDWRYRASRQIVERHPEMWTLTDVREGGGTTWAIGEL